MPSHGGVQSMGKPQNKPLRPKGLGMGGGVLATTVTHVNGDAAHTWV